MKGEIVVFRGLSDAFDMILDDGRSLAISGIAFHGGQQTRDILSGWLAGSTITIRPLAGVPDRWGRQPVQIRFVQAGQDRLTDLAQAVLDAGLGLYQPSPAGHPCKVRLLAAENRARLARTGFWASGDLTVIAATDRQKLAAAPPGLTLVEGTIVNIGETIGRYYLNFGEIRGANFTLVVAKRNKAVLTLLNPGEASAIVPPSALIGQTLRIRGLLDRRFGPQMELADGDALEILTQSPATSRLQ